MHLEKNEEEDEDDDEFDLDKEMGGEKDLGFDDGD